MMANRAERAHPRPTHLKKPQRGQRQRAHNSAVIWPHDLPLLLSHWPNNCYTLCYATSRPPMIGIRNSSYHRNSSEIVFFKYQRLFISYLWLCQIWLLSQRLAVMIFLTTGCFVCLMINRCDLLSNFKKGTFCFRLSIIAFFSECWHVVAKMSLFAQKK